MRTTIFATAAVFGVGIGAAYTGDGAAANTRFTEIPGVVAQARVQQEAPSIVATNQYGAPTAA
jgi:hypothetical protein